MELITWIAHYNDGSELRQRNGTEKATYQDIDRENLAAFTLQMNDQPLVIIDFRDDTNDDPEIGRKRLIWRIRHQMDSKGNRVKIHLAGWQRNIKGRNVQAIYFVTQNGTVVLGGQWQPELPLRHGVKPLSHEIDLTE